MKTIQAYAYYQESFEVYQFKWIPYGHGLWYNPDEKSYDDAVEEIKKIIYAKAKKDHPHLYFNEVIQVKSNDYKMPEMEAMKDLVNSLPPVWKYPNPNATSEKIKSGTIEEQIQACTTEDELKSFKLIAKMNNKVWDVYILKKQQLQDVKHTKLQK